MFTKRFPLMTIMGFKIYLDLSWFLVVVLITWSLAGSAFPHLYPGLSTAAYWGMGMVGALGLFASILLHELGHAYVARLYGVPMRGITLFIFGGVAEMDREPPNAKVEFLVAIAGPIVSIVLTAALLAAAAVTARLGAPDTVNGVLWYLGVINGIVVVFNLMPAFPLDGGRVLRSALWALKGNLKWATRITAALGSGFGLFLILLGVVTFIQGNIIGGMWQFLIGMFLRGAAQMSYQQVLIRKALEGDPVSRFMQRDVRTVEPTLTIREFVEDHVYPYQHKLFPVTQEGKLLGSITLRDVKSIPREAWDEQRVGDVLSPCGERNCVSPDTDAMQLLSQMNRDKISRLMVVEGDELRGIITLKNMLDFISLKVELEEEGGRHVGGQPVLDPFERPRRSSREEKLHT